MLIFAIDDERPLLAEAQRAIREAAPDAEIMAFSSAEDALDAIRTQGHSPNIVFSDIEMPGLSGLEFAVALKTVSPDTRVVFVTGFSQYAVEAFRMRAHGYIMKPLKKELVETELRYLPQMPKPEQEKLTVRCFGYFEVFWHGEPLKFERRQTKELLAYLVDRRGATCSAEEVVADSGALGGRRRPQGSKAPDPQPRKRPEIHARSDRDGRRFDQAPWKPYDPSRLP